MVLIYLAVFWMCVPVCLLPPHLSRSPSTLVALLSSTVSPRLSAPHIVFFFAEALYISTKKYKKSDGVHTCCRCP
jgi:hypothetical protein